MDTTTGTWPDVPANYLGGDSCGLSYADGHSEVHKWVTTALTGPNCAVIQGVSVSSISATPGGKNNADYVWWRIHTACRPGTAPGT